MEVNNTTGLPALDIDGHDVGTQWRRWKRAFHIFLEAKGITEPSRQKAMLLHFAGMGVQDIYFNLPESETTPPALASGASVEVKKKREALEF